jgi:hypothetical protein
MGARPGQHRRGNVDGDDRTPRSDGPLEEREVAARAAPELYHTVPRSDLKQIDGPAAIRLVAKANADCEARNKVTRLKGSEKMGPVAHCGLPDPGLSGGRTPRQAHRPIK